LWGQAVCPKAAADIKMKAKEARDLAGFKAIITKAKTEVTQVEALVNAVGRRATPVLANPPEGEALDTQVAAIEKAATEAWTRFETCRTLIKDNFKTVQGYAPEAKKTCGVQLMELNKKRADLGKVCQAYKAFKISMPRMIEAAKIIAEVLSAPPAPSHPRVTSPPTGRNSPRRLHRLRPAVAPRDATPPVPLTSGHLASHSGPLGRGGPSHKATQQSSRCTSPGRALYERLHGEQGMDYASASDEGKPLERTASLKWQAAVEKMKKPGWSFAGHLRKQEASVQDSSLVSGRLYRHGGKKGSGSEKRTRVFISVLAQRPFRKPRVVDFAAHQHAHTARVRTAASQPAGQAGSKKKERQAAQAAWRARNKSKVQGYRETAKKKKPAEKRKRGAEVSSAELFSGASVRLCGLKRAAFNGMTGTCGHFDSARERWIVRLENGEQKSFKAENLEVEVRPEADKDAAEDCARMASDQESLRRQEALMHPPTDAPQANDKYAEMYKRKLEEIMKVRGSTLVA